MFEGSIYRAFLFENKLNITVTGIFVIPLNQHIMRKIQHLSSCDTCQRIIKELDLKEKSFQFQDIKTQNISAEELDAAKEKIGSYEALFSKRAQKFRKVGLNDMQLAEADYRKYILAEYTFLKRPFIWIGDEVFVGNAKKMVEAAKAALDE